jgi:creatinine amidohydrolase
MTARPYVLREINWAAVQRTEYRVAVLPWGATEPHNFHLPYGTDNYEAEAVAVEAAALAWEAGARVVILPTVPFGVNSGQLDLPLTINLNPSSQFVILRDVLDSLERHGINRLVLLNGHGGNDFKTMIRELQVTHRALIAQLNWWVVEKAAGYFNEPGDHAGELETSVMLHLHPDIVLPLDEAGLGGDRVPAIGAFREGWAWTPRKWTQVSADTGVGNPKAANADKGKRFLDAVTRKVADFLVQFDAIADDEFYVDRSEI